MPNDVTKTPSWLADVVWDLETNGLLHTVSKIHCGVIINRRTREVHRYGPHQIAELYEQLAKYRDLGFSIAGHNAIKYDIPVSHKLIPDFFIPKDQVVDTLVLSRLIWPDIKENDLPLLKSKRLPGKLWGKHSLKAWGYRLGVLKGEYGEQEDAWEVFTPEMLDYCEQDCWVTVALLELIERKAATPTSIWIEHQMAFLMAQQERNGFPFNEAAATELYVALTKRRTEIEGRLSEWFPPWQVDLGEFIPKVNNAKMGYVKGVPIRRYKEMVFNPGSRDHIAERLMTLFGWEPTVFTDGGKPQVDEDVLKGLPYPPIADLNEYLMIQKRISMLADGNSAWLKLVTNGKLHGTVITNGTVTGRATHAYPNVAQTPASKSPYGKECRALFGAPDGWYLVGSDTSGLELRCLGHFMAKFDDGAYINVLLTGDVHTLNQNAAGLPTRDNAKTFIYGYLYGAGDEKIGQIVGAGAERGKQLKSDFLKKTPALAALKDAITMGMIQRSKDASVQRWLHEEYKPAAAKGKYPKPPYPIIQRAYRNAYIVGLDGRNIPIRSAHSALNTLLQSAGALICKLWLIYLDEELERRGYKHGWDGDYAFCAWVHDEAQIAARTEEIAKVIAELAPQMAAKAGEFFNFRCPITGESKIGRNWAETH